MPEPVRRIEVFTGAGRRRAWSPEEKATIVAESYGEGEAVCAVARRHGLTPQQLITWRRQSRVEAVSEAPAMLVHAVVEVPPPESMPPSPAPRWPRRRSKADEIELEIGAVAVRVGRDAIPRTFDAVIRALKAGS